MSPSGPESPGKPKQQRPRVAAVLASLNPKAGEVSGSSRAEAPAGGALAAQVLPRLARLERSNRRLKLALLALLIGAAAIFAYTDFGQHTLVRHTLVESKELKLFDAQGAPRVFLRMYSKVPVLQLLDAAGKPRLSLGLRFDDTPFIDLSDRSGRTRASLQLNAKGTPSLVMYDANGDIVFKIK